MSWIPKRVSLFTLLLSAPASMLAQDLPTTQPRLLTIYREEVKVGREAEHAKIEAGWPAAYERAKSPDYYLGMVSVTGPSEAWFLVPRASHAAMADAMKREAADPVLTAELARLTRADAEVLNNVRVLQAVARTDLSYGAFPNLARERFWEITWFRVRPGHEQQFDGAAKAYMAAAKRSSPDASWRTYEIMAGNPGPTYLIFSSVPSFSDFDKMMEGGMKVMQGLTPEEGATLQKFSSEGLINTETNRFRLDPQMSYASRETRAVDPEFWMPKKVAMKKAPQP